MEGMHQKPPSFFIKFGGPVMEKADNDLNIRCFTKRQIKSITDNYKSMLGKGGFSVVYKGRLDDGRPVAVKRYIFTSKEKEFTKEVIIQSQFSHRNIVKLLGCCIEEDALMLVTEFVPNGNLSDFLHCLSPQVPLSMEKRLQIASDVAEALLYMHTSQSHPILHGDIKPENILLDNNYMPKLADFGISRLLSVSSNEYTGYVIGSMGYIDPEFCQTGRLTTKSDVYSFGVVLLELMTRKKAIDDRQNFLAKPFVHASTKSCRHELFDKEIATTENMAALDDIVDLALECVKFDMEERPEMRDVSECLWKIQRTREDKRCEQIVSSLQQNGFRRFISKEQIKNNFKSKPVECFMGKIYKETSGEIPSLAVKMSCNVTGVLKEFSNQMMLHSKVHHKNVVNFEGCCLDGDMPILVYEFAKANLHDILFGDRCQNLSISIEGRQCIAISIAEGLGYLHSLDIIHGDLRTTNVLVMKDISKHKYVHHVPTIKVSGIGASVYLAIAKSAHERIKAGENNGYMDPRFLESGTLTKEADIYSLGVVLLELFTGKMAVNRIRNCPLEKLWDKYCWHIKETRNIIFRCLDPDVRKRPNLKEAIWWFRVERITSDDRQNSHLCGSNCVVRMSGW